MCRHGDRVRERADHACAAGEGLARVANGTNGHVIPAPVAYDLLGNVKVLLGNIRKIAGISTYGRPRWMAWYMGDPPRKMVTRYMKRLTARQARVDYHAHYHMNVATPDRLTAFRDRVGQAMARLA